jgi:glycoprotein-N-acetylgalactosamine 3-beta-galactosyltransferase
MGSAAVVTRQRPLSMRLWGLTLALLCIAGSVSATPLAPQLRASTDAAAQLAFGPQLPSTSQSSPATNAPTPSLFTLAQKKELCNRDHNNYNRALELMTVEPKIIGLVKPPLLSTRANASTPETTASAATTIGKYPRIFCYVGTISTYHKTHAQLVADTWGQRCDKLVFFSNVTGTMTVNKGTPFEVNFPIIKMNAPSDYWHLWMKHKEVLKYVYDHYRHDYDWFYKADDDAYVVVDNLRDYLKRPEIVMNYKRQPIHLGHRFNLTAERIHGYIDGADKIMGDRWWTKWDRWVFNSGGPGYAMNRLYLDKFVASMDDRTCLSAEWAQRQPEDTATAYCMMWHNVVPWDTRDTHGRPRWHAGSPNTVYGLTPEMAKGWWFDYHVGVGGMKWGKDCCAPDTIGFHYIKGKAMHHIERQLYFCREGDDVLDLETYNRKYGVGISDAILTV